MNAETKTPQTITWTAPTTDPAEKIRGKTYIGGCTDVMGGVQVVVFDSPRVDGKKLCARTDTRPELYLLADRYDSTIKSAQDAREARWAAEREKEMALQKPLLAAMATEIIRLKSLIPAENIEAAVTEIGRSDGDPILEYAAGGIKISWQDAIIHGWAQAIRPGALAAFRSECVASIPRAKLEEIKSKQQAEADAKIAKLDARANERTAKFAEAAATGKPVELRRWTETRRAQEGGEWGEYMFVCSEMAQADGSIKETAINTY